MIYLSDLKQKGVSRGRGEKPVKVLDINFMLYIIYNMNTIYIYIYQIRNPPHPYYTQYCLRH